MHALAPPQAIPDLSALSSLTDLSAGGNRLTGGGALGPLPACLTKLVLRENNLGEVPLALLEGLPALQVWAGTWRVATTAVFSLFVLLGCHKRSCLKTPWTEGPCVVAVLRGLAPHWMLPDVPYWLALKTGPHPLACL